MAYDLDTLHETLARQQLPWTARYNPLLELTDEERRLRLGYVPEGDELSLEEREARSTAQRSEALADVAVTPAAWDWRNVGGRSFISSVKDQGQCGSCVAFGTAATIDGMMRVGADVAMGDPASGTLQDLSEAQLYFCSPAGHNCASGWNVSAALAYAQTTGLAPEAAFPYGANDQPCNLAAGWQAQVTKVKASHMIGDAPSMKAWLATRGPLITCFSVYSDFFGYGGGVYIKSAGANYRGGHCVCCIGYSDQLQAWLCKNSWGGGWGMGGYFWIGYGQCGIDAAMWAVDSLSPLYPLYGDVYQRDNLSDVGQVPSPGPPSTSPDIIPYGTNAPSDPNATLGAAAWMQDLGQDVVQGLENLIYLRALNLFPGAQSASAYLYYSPASIILWPSQWRNNLLDTQSGADHAALSFANQGQVLVSEPFQWNPSSLPGADHYCLISRIVTPTNPNPVPADFPSVEAFATYVLNTPPVGWRNVTMVNPGNTTVQVPVHLSMPTSEQFYILLQCENLPVGSSVGFSCATPGPTPPLNLGLVAVTNSVSFEVGITSAIPAGFAADLVVTFAGNGQQLLPGAKITLQAIYLPPADSALHAALAARPAHARLTVETEENIAPQQAILLGSYTVMLVR